MSLFSRKTTQGSNDQPAEPSPPSPAISPEQSIRARPVEVDFDLNDPFFQYLVNVSGVVEVDKVNVRSTTLDSLKELGVRVIVPLISQGELIGILNLGPRMSEQDYSSDDRRLLNTLSTQAAPALKVAQLARRQQAEARERERMEQELRVARVIQQTLLPKEIPQVENWCLDAIWQPARAVSGDFYDFIQFEDGFLGIITGDVTDKGVPASLVMATTRTILRSAAARNVSPGEVLKRANDTLIPDIPRNMFVTCQYILLDPVSGEFILANAGHNLPYKKTDHEIIEIVARGMPLGLLPGMEYEEVTGKLDPGETLLLYSDGLTEAHDPQGEMFDFRRVKQNMLDLPENKDIIQYLLAQLALFTGPDWELEDDITLVVVERQPMIVPNDASNASDLSGSAGDSRLLLEFELPSEPGNERLAMQQVAEVVLRAGFPEERIERLKTAVAETTMNAMEYGNHYRREVPARIRVELSPGKIIIFVTDQGGGQEIPEHTEPNLEAKLAGLQSPRGWGLYLIQHMVDEMLIHRGDAENTVELRFNMNPNSHQERGQ